MEKQNLHLFLNTYLMKRIDELLKILLQYFGEGMYDDRSLCWCAEDLRDAKIFTREEWYKITNFIKENRPRDLRIGAFSWAPGDIEPRVEWLVYYIKLLNH